MGCSSTPSRRWVGSRGLFCSVAGIHIYMRGLFKYQGGFWFFFTLLATEELNALYNGC